MCTSLNLHYTVVLVHFLRETEGLHLGPFWDFHIRGISMWICLISSWLYESEVEEGSEWEITDLRIFSFWVVVMNELNFLGIVCREERSLKTQLWEIPKFKGLAKKKKKNWILLKNGLLLQSKEEPKKFSENQKNVVSWIWGWRPGKISYVLVDKIFLNFCRI